MNFRRNLYVYALLALVAVFQNLIHEGLHALLALLMGVGVQEFRFLSNGWLTSQVIYAVPVEQRTGAHWLLIGLGPSVITVLIGYTVYLLRRRLLTAVPALNLAIWYVGALFMTIDPIYLGGVSWLMQGSDVNALQVVGLPTWPLQIAALAAALYGIWLVVRWRTEARQEVQRYALPQANA